jgi:hypothetical protein
MSDAAVTASRELALPLEERAKDFGDWMSPVLVKELRQGLKTRMFMSAFITIQATMVILLGMRLLSHAQPGNEWTGEVVEGLLWTALGFTILVVMPLRGLTAISEEVKANTLDLVALTKMSTFRIVAGKWLALMAQTLLIMIAVLPYAVLRYFFGQVDIVNDLYVLVMMLLASSVSTALSIALSTAAPVFRWMVTCVVVIVSFSMVGGVFASRAMFSGMGGSGDLLVAMTVSVLVSVCYTLFLLLETTARVAPLAESHGWMRRLLPLLVFPACWIGHLVGGDDLARSIGFAFVPMLAWAIVCALTEHTNALPVVYVPWERWGLLGRAAGLLLHPGWATGVIYTGLLTGGVMLTDMLLHYEPELWLRFTLLYAALLMPVPLLRIAIRAKNRIALYLLVQCLALLWLTVALINNEDATMASLVPTSAFFISTNYSFGNSKMDVLSTLGLGTATLLIVLVLVMAGKGLLAILQLHRRAAEMISPSAKNEPS